GGGGADCRRGGWSPHESSPVIADRAAGVLARVAQQADERRVDEALADAAEGSTAVAGVTATVGAVNRNAVRHLYVLTTFREPGAVCQDCGALQRGVHFVSVLSPGHTD